MPARLPLRPLVLALTLLALACGTPQSAPAQPQPQLQPGALSASNLRCEHLVSPLNVREPAPRLGWTLAADSRDQRQTAYRILVASAPELLARDRGDLWDSGQVSRAETAHVEYAGKPLTSGQACW